MGEACNHEGSSRPDIKRADDLSLPDYTSGSWLWSISTRGHK